MQSFGLDESIAKWMYIITALEAEDLTNEVLDHLYDKACSACGLCYEYNNGCCSSCEGCPLYKANGCECWQWNPMQELFNRMDDINSDYWELKSHDRYAIKDIGMRDRNYMLNRAYKILNTLTDMRDK